MARYPEDSETKVMATLMLLAYFILAGVIVGRELEKMRRKDDDLMRRLGLMEAKTRALPLPPPPETRAVYLNGDGSLTTEKESEYAKR